MGPRKSNSIAPAAQDGRGLGDGIGWGGIAGGLAAGGLLGMLLGAKKARKKVGELTGGVVGYGSAAAPGASVYRAYRNWQTGKRVGAGGGSPVSAPVQPPRGFEVPARNGASA